MTSNITTKSMTRQEFNELFAAKLAAKKLRGVTAAKQSDFLILTQQRLTAFIESSTRFSITNIQFNEINEHIEKLEVEATHCLDTIALTCVEAGVVHGDVNDFENQNRNLYNEDVQQALLLVTHRAETMEELKVYLRNSHYAAIRDKTLCYEHPHKFLHSYICDHCDGHGNLTCTSCGGRGQTTCGSCGGSGSIQELVQETQQISFHDGTSWRTRPEIESRYVRKGCGCCGGGGYNICVSCNGSGKKVCQPCEGSGWLTEITTIQTVTYPQYHLLYQADSPEYIIDAVKNKAGIFNLRNGYAEQLNMMVSVNYAQLTVTSSTLFQIPFVKLKLTAVGISSYAIAFGYSAMILDTGHIIENLIKGDFERLVQGVTFKYQIKPSFNKHISPILSDFIESEIHQKMLNITGGNVNSGGANIRHSWIKNILQSLRNIDFANILRKVRVAVKYILIAHLSILALAFFAVHIFDYLGGEKYFANNIYVTEVIDASNSNLWMLILYCFVATIFFIIKYQKREISNVIKTYEAIDRSLSTEHIRQSLNKIHIATQTEMIWIVIKYSMIASILTIPGLLITELMLRYFDAKKLMVSDSAETYLVSVNTSNFLLLFIYCLVATIILFVAISWKYTRWLKKCGGHHLVQYSKSQKLSPALGVALWLPVPILFVSYIFIAQQGIWVDMKGNLYGSIPYIASQNIHH